MLQYVLPPIRLIRFNSKNKKEDTHLTVKLRMIAKVFIHLHNPADEESTEAFFIWSRTQVHSVRLLRETSCSLAAMLDYSHQRNHILLSVCYKERTAGSTAAC